MFPVGYIVVQFEFNHVIVTSPLEWLQILFILDFV
jgi:hypothetical protein